jgi:primosomal protein N' (replication factor Y)
MRNPTLVRSARQMRVAPTPAERHLWQALRGDALGVTFRRQHPIPPYIADFACVALKLIVEVDGADHDESSDAFRDDALRQGGWRVLRYRNNDVLANRVGVIEDIARLVVELKGKRWRCPHPGPPPRSGGGCLKASRSARRCSCGCAWA